MNYFSSQQAYRFLASTETSLSFSMCSNHRKYQNTRCRYIHLIPCGTNPRKHQNTRCRCICLFISVLAHAARMWFLTQRDYLSKTECASRSWCKLRLWVEVVSWGSDPGNRGEQEEKQDLEEKEKIKRHILMLVTTMGNQSCFSMENSVIECKLFPVVSILWAYLSFALSPDKGLGRRLAFRNWADMPWKHKVQGNKMGMLRASAVYLLFYSIGMIPVTDISNIFWIMI